MFAFAFFDEERRANKQANEQDFVVHAIIWVLIVVTRVFIRAATNKGLFFLAPTKYIPNPKKYVRRAKFRASPVTPFWELPH